MCNVLYLLLGILMSLHSFVQALRAADILANEVVSLFVIEKLELVPRDQSRLIAAKDLTSGDMVKLVARVVRQNRGPSFVPKYKYCLDSVSSTVYVLVPDAEDAQLMAGCAIKVDGQDICFYHVLKIEERSADVDLFQSLPCLKIWPLSDRPDA